MVQQHISRVAASHAPVSPVRNRYFGTLSIGSLGKGATKARVVGSRKDKAVERESAFVQHTDGNIPSDTATASTAEIQEARSRAQCRNDPDLADSKLVRLP